MSCTVADHAFNQKITTDTVRIDTTKPDTTITRGPRQTTLLDGTFTFKSSETRSTFPCSLDGSKFKPCKPPKTYTHLKVGKHLFKMAAVDRAGNVDPKPAVHRWRIINGTV